MVEEKFSIERFESIMVITGTTWDQINQELKFNAEGMLKHPKKPPMNNVIVKACRLMGLENTDYVMMRGNTYYIKSINVGQHNKYFSVGRPRKINDAQLDEAIMMLENMTYKQVALHFNMAESTLYRLVQNRKKENKTMNIPIEVKEAVTNNEGNRGIYKSNPQNNKGFMSDIFYKIDRITDEELEKVQEYLNATRKIRAIRNSLL